MFSPNRRAMDTAESTDSLSVDLTNEARLILFLARGRVSPDECRQSIHILSRSLDWDYIVEEVRSQHVYPLVYNNLEALGFYRVPKDARAKLISLFKTNHLRNALLSEELGRILHLFSEAEIPAIPLKGLALAQWLYGDPALRACADMDILVSRGLVAMAMDLLKAHGYESEAKTKFFADLLLRTGKECEFRRKSEGCSFLIDLHWGFLWGGRSERQLTQKIWTNAYPSTIFGAPAYELSAEWQFLLLSAHAARHQWQGLKWLVDIHDLCSSKNIKWNEVNKHASALGWQRIVSLALVACHRLFATPIPPEIASTSLPGSIKLFPESGPDSARDPFLPLRLMPRASMRLRYFVERLLLPTAAESRIIALPQYLSFLYCFLRVLRLGWKWRSAIMRSTFSSIATRHRSRVLRGAAAFQAFNRNRGIE
jgi:hypothetical protein